MSMLADTMERIDLALRALGGAEERSKACQCDHDVGYYCEACAVLDGLLTAKRQLLMEEAIKLEQAIETIKTISDVAYLNKVSSKYAYAAYTVLMSIHRRSLAPLLGMLGVPFKWDEPDYGYDAVIESYVSATHALYRELVEKQQALRHKTEIPS